MFRELVARQVKWLIFECVPQVKVRSLDVIVALLVGSIVVVIVSRGMLVRASGLSLAMLALLLLLSFLVLLFLLFTFLGLFKGLLTLQLINLLLLALQLFYKTIMFFFRISWLCRLIFFIILIIVLTFIFVKVLIHVFFWFFFRLFALLLFGLFRFMSRRRFFLILILFLFIIFFVFIFLINRVIVRQLPVE